MAPIRCCFDQTAVWHSDAARGPSTPSLDHLIGAGKQRRRHFEAEHPCGLGIDDQLELGRLHDRQFRWLGTLEDAAAIDACLTISVGNARSVAHQTASFSNLTVTRCHWNRVARRQGRKLHPPTGEKRVEVDEEGIEPLAHKRRESRIDLRAATRVEDLDLQSYGAS